MLASPSPMDVHAKRCVPTAGWLADISGVNGGGLCSQNTKLIFCCRFSAVLLKGTMNSIRGRIRLFLCVSLTALHNLSKKCNPIKLSAKKARGCCFFSFPLTKWRGEGTRELDGSSHNTCPWRVGTEVGQKGGEERPLLRGDLGLLWLSKNPFKRTELRLKWNSTMSSHFD